jgi:hypothetical protein
MCSANLSAKDARAGHEPALTAGLLFQDLVVNTTHAGEAPRAERGAWR